jgi:endonuclease III
MDTAGTPGGDSARRTGTSYSTRAMVAASPKPGVSTARVREIHARLKRRFGPLEPPPRREPLEELILTVLSQNTSDVNRDRAFRSLRRRFPSWEALAAADRKVVAETIRAGGLSNIKAPRILAILREIREREGGSLDLSWMEAASPGRVRTYLLSLPGVGPKTAACVLAFSLRRAALPVDTHVHRVARRLGFFPDRTDPAAAHVLMEAAVPARIRVRMHVGMIRLGRAVCRAGRPSCEVCPVFDLCPTGPRMLSGMN